MSHQQYAESLVSVPLEAPLYWAFSGFAPAPGFVEEITDRLLSRRF